MQTQSDRFAPDEGGRWRGRGAARFLASVVVVFAAAAGGCAATSKPTERPYNVQVGFGVDDPRFERTISNLLGPPLQPGNRAATLVDGPQIFPTMLAAIRGAQRAVHFETFIYWSGRTGAEFAEALSERARAGVQVRVIIDDFGSDLMHRGNLKQMRDAGVHLIKYHPLKWHSFIDTHKMENRTHRKLLIVDGKVGFTGGVGIADEWAGDPERGAAPWRDTHYEMRGPVVAQLQAAFADNWMETTGEVLTGDDHFPPLKEEGHLFAQVFRSSPPGGSESMQLMYLLSIAAARQDVRLATAYFVPDALTIRTLLEARNRGVRVQVIVPGKKMDVKVVRAASRARWGKLLKAGVEVYEYEPTMFHCKQMIVDDRWVSVGSANLDNRSFQMNDEVNMNVLDAAFAAEQIKLFDADVSRSKRVTYEQWQRRPLTTKLGESFISLFGWLL